MYPHCVCIGDSCVAHHLMCAEAGSDLETKVYKKKDLNEARSRLPRSQVAHHSWAVTRIWVLEDCCRALAAVLLTRII
eukprot:16146-Amphidinium_carterae.1